MLRVPAGAALPILVKTWSGRGSHRYGYIRRSLPRLLASDLPPDARVIVVDDRSDDPRLLRLLQALTHDRRVELWKNPHRMGPNRGQAYNVPRIIERFPDAEFLVFCDDDVVYKPGWLQRTLQVAREAEAIGLTGVFTALNVPFRPTYGSQTLPTSEVFLKQRQAALNWVVPRAVYEHVGPFRDVGIAYDTEYCDRMAALSVPVICLKPSWVQNIGYLGAYQYDTTYTAPDFVGRLGVSLSLGYVYQRLLGRALAWGSLTKDAIRARVVHASR